MESWLELGVPSTVIGYEESSQLDVEPAKYFVLFMEFSARFCVR
jgi:hypothetical protein